MLATTGLVGCSDVDGSRSDMMAEPDGDTGEPEPMPEVRLDLGGPPGTGTGDVECASFTETAVNAKKPADIMFVVDNSPSMAEEADAVQARLNDFSRQIVDAEIDVRVFLLTAYPNPNFPPQFDTGICIGPPLGSGGCPSQDNNPPAFSHLQEIITSADSLERLLDTHATWSQIVRPESVKHIIVVSDDDSGLAATDFDSQFRALDPSYADYSMHGIVSLADCPAAAQVGHTYVTLAGMTDGIIGDLCDQDFQPLFDLLSTAVIEGTDLACDWAVPEAPEGLWIDPASVDVRFDDGSGARDLQPVANEGACAGVEFGWYYDNPAAPERIFACPQTCTSIQDASSATIDIDVGCAGPPVG